MTDSAPWTGTYYVGTYRGDPEHLGTLMRDLEAQGLRVEPANGFRGASPDAVDPGTVIGLSVVGGVLADLGASAIKAGVRAGLDTFRTRNLPRTEVDETDSGEDADD